VFGGALGTAAPRDDVYRYLRVFEDVVSLVVNNYVETVDVDKVMGGAVAGLSDALDADSGYLPPALAALVEKPGPEGVTGIELTRQYYLRVIAARDGSPAHRAGVQPGDYVRAIDSRATRDMSIVEGAHLLRGAVGSSVKLTIVRGNVAEPVVVDIVRERATAPAVTTRTAAPGVGVVRVAAFDAGAATLIGAETTKLLKAGAGALVIDLRATASGRIEEGFAAARLFVASGVLGSLAARRGDPEVISAQRGDGAIGAPAVVLVDQATSGAAEVFAAALAGAKRAELIGERTFGRAARQKLVRLPNGSALWLTYARYMTPAGEPIHEKGVTPDIDVEGDADPAAGADAALAKALERLAVRKAA
jgi:carboxyl-terminal processing protease